MAKKVRFDPDIPDDMRYLASYEEVAGISFRMKNALAFVKGRNHRIELEEEPDNDHDPNAIKVIGVYKGWFFTHRVHIGYVPAELARAIADRELFDEIVPCLRNIWWGGHHKDVIYINFAILEPKPAKPAKPRAKKPRKRPAK